MRHRGRVHGVGRRGGGLDGGGHRDVVGGNRPVTNPAVVQHLGLHRQVSIAHARSLLQPFRSNETHDEGERQTLLELPSLTEGGEDAGGGTVEVDSGALRTIEGSDGESPVRARGIEVVLLDGSPGLALVGCGGGWGLAERELDRLVEERLERCESAGGGKESTRREGSAGGEPLGATELPLCGRIPRCGVHLIGPSDVGARRALATTRERRRENESILSLSAAMSRLAVRLARSLATKAGPSATPVDPHPFLSQINVGGGAHAGPFPIGRLDRDTTTRRAEKEWRQMKSSEKVNEAATQFSSLLVVAFGAGLAGLVIYATGTELFATNSPTRIFEDCVERIRESSEVREPSPSLALTGE